MVFRAPKAAPESRLAPERRGAVVGRFCLGCSQVFPLQRSFHSGNPISGRDHVASTCAYEGWRFEPDVKWWEPAVEVLPAPAPEASAAATGAPAGSAAAAPPPAAGQPQTTSAPQQGQPAPAPPKP